MNSLSFFKTKGKRGQGDVCGSSAFAWLGAAAALQGPAGSASCREHSSFRSLDLPLFVLRKHFALTSGREGPALWHAATACQLGPRMGIGKESRDGNPSPQSSSAAGRVSSSPRPRDPLSHLCLLLNLSIILLTPC